MKRSRVPHELTFKQGYQDAKQDAARGEIGYNYTGLPADYVRGYVAGKREIMMMQHIRKAQ